MTKSVIFILPLQWVTLSKILENLSRHSTNMILRVTSNHVASSLLQTASLRLTTLKQVSIHLHNHSIQLQSLLFQHLNRMMGLSKSHLSFQWEVGTVTNATIIISKAESSATNACRKSARNCKLKSNTKNANFPPEDGNAASAAITTLKVKHFAKDARKWNAQKTWTECQSTCFRTVHLKAHLITSRW